MELILRDVLLILRVCINTVEHFRLKPPLICGNHEIALISPADNPLVSPNIMDSNGDENKPSSFYSKFKLKEK